MTEAAHVHPAESALRALLSQYRRVIICGWPHTGKTTLARAVYGMPIHLDAFIGPDWSESSERAVNFLVGRDQYLAEGTMGLRVIRKAAKMFPHDVSWQPQALLYLGPTMVMSALDKVGQKTMGMGTDRVLGEVRTGWRPDLRVVEF